MHTIASSAMLIARDIATWDAYIHAIASGDHMAIARLHADAAAITINGGTALRVDEDLATLARITVLDGPWIGLQGLATWQSLPALRTAA